MKYIIRSMCHLRTEEGGALQPSNTISCFGRQCARRSQYITKHFTRRGLTVVFLKVSKATICATESENESKREGAARHRAGVSKEGQHSFCTCWSVCGRQRTK